MSLRFLRRTSINWGPLTAPIALLRECYVDMVKLDWPHGAIDVCVPAGTREPAAASTPKSLGSHRAFVCAPTPQRLTDFLLPAGTISAERRAGETASPSMDMPGVVQPRAAFCTS